jgi:hypothetical protein
MVLPSGVAGADLPSKPALELLAPDRNPLIRPVSTPLISPMISVLTV